MEVASDDDVGLCPVCHQDLPKCNIDLVTYGHVVCITKCPGRWLCSQEGLHRTVPSGFSKGRIRIEALNELGFDKVQKSDRELDTSFAEVDWAHCESALKVFDLSFLEEAKTLEAEYEDVVGIILRHAIFLINEKILPEGNGQLALARESTLTLTSSSHEIKSNVEFVVRLKCESIEYSTPIVLVVETKTSSTFSKIDSDVQARREAVAAFLYITQQRVYCINNCEYNLLEGIPLSVQTWVAEDIDDIPSAPVGIAVLTCISETSIYEADTETTLSYLKLSESNPKMLFSIFMSILDDQVRNYFNPA